MTDTLKTPSCERDITVTRTGNQEVSVVFPATPFARGARAKDGIKYPAFPEVTPETMEAARNFFGDDNWFPMINESIRLWVQGTFDAVIENNGGVFDEATFIKYMQELSTRKENKDQIESKLKELQGQLVEVAAKAQANPGDAAKFMGEFMSITAEIKRWNVVLESKKRMPRKPKNEEEDDAVEAKS